MSIMQVNQISIYSSKYSYNPNKALQKSQNRAIESESSSLQSQIPFCGISGRDLVKSHALGNSLKAFKSFTKEEYENLSSIQLSDLRTRYKKLEAEFPVELKNFGEMHSYAAECIKFMFDKNFGKGKYVVVPIGRSLSSISKALEMKIGSENVVNVPISDAKRFYSKFVDIDSYKKFLTKVKSENGFKDFLSFLKSKNLTREDIEKSGKQYILIDYCYSGESLAATEKLFKSDLVWGNKNKNIHAVDFINILENVEPVKLPNSSVPQEADKILFKFCSDLFCSSYKDYSVVDRAENFSETIQASKILDTASEKAKLVLFNVLDTASTRKGESVVKMVPKSEEEKLLSKLVENQKIDDWHDSSTQYHSDIQNEANEINKLLVYVENLPQKKSTPVKEMVSHLSGINKYIQVCSENINDISLMRNFYAIRSEIDSMIENVYSLIK